MKRYQVFLENLDGSGKGQIYEVETVEQVWSWLNLIFPGDDVARLWWVKDRDESKFFSEVQKGKAWFIPASKSKIFKWHLFDNQGQSE